MLIRSRKELSVIKFYQSPKPLNPLLKPRALQDPAAETRNPEPETLNPESAGVPLDALSGPAALSWRKCRKGYGLGFRL